MKLLLIGIVCLGVLSITIGCLMYKEDRFTPFQLGLLISNCIAFGFNVNTLLSWKK